MGNGSKSHKVLLDQIAEFMARETEGMSDEDILDEALDTNESAPSNVEKLRQLLEERATKARRERLAQSRAKYDAAMAIRGARANRTRPPISEIRRRIQEVFTNRGEIASGVAFRNGEFQSDDDLLSLWDNLCELGIIDQDDTGKQ